VTNHFRYRLFMMFLDLAELPELFHGRLAWSADRAAPAWFRRKDYLGDPEQPLARAVSDRVEAATGRPVTGPIRLLTNLRTFGYCFNPVSFYYCYDWTGASLATIVAEITNTPWGERHAYVLPCPAGPARHAHQHFRFRKAFHVSPFMDMDLDYDWRFSDPGDRLLVHMDNLERGDKLFDATLVLHRREITGAALNRALLRYPLLTLQIITRIHLQALRLWLKRCPFYVHPGKRGAVGKGTQ
jgi:DUF1365 family protein